MLLAARKLFAACVVAFLLSLTSVLVERTGPEVVQYGNMCGASASEPCTRLQLKGGFPVAYLFDSGGVSVEKQLGPEDKLIMSAFFLNCGVIAAVVLLIPPVVSWATAISRRSKSSGLQ